MSDPERDAIDDEAPEADLLEQERPDVDEVPDPEAPLTPGVPSAATLEAEEADVLEQSIEVPGEDDYPTE